MKKVGLKCNACGAQLMPPARLGKDRTVTVVIRAKNLAQEHYMAVHPGVMHADVAWVTSP